MYRNSVDAFMHLLSRGDEDSGLAASAVASISVRISNMRNGIQYCIVQIAFENGAEYRVEAFGEEAEELYREAKTKASLQVCTH